MTNGTEPVTLYVTHANASGRFLKIWGQINNEESRRIERLINRLHERFQNGEGAISPQTILNSGSICCAFHEDNYYRARIIKVDPDFTVQVHFIDYGNLEVVLPTAIRLLDRFADGLELIALPAIAHEFTMIKVMPYSGIWNDNIVAHIKQTLIYKEHEAIVTFPSKQLITLFYNGTDFSDYLLSSKMALPSSAAEKQMISKMCEQSIPPPMLQQSIYQPVPPNMPYDNRLNNNYSMRPRQSVKDFSPPKMITRENWRQPNQQSLLQQRSPLLPQPSTQPEQSHGFINPVLEKDSIQYVTVSNIVDGPLVFSVQMQHRAQELDTLMKNINNHPLQSLSQRADIATVCLARESKHNTIRRAVVSYVGDPRAAKLFYVDYGDSETLSHSRIYDIPPQYIKPLALSVRFSLSGLSDIFVTKKMKQYFQELVKDKVLTVKIQPEEFHSPLMSFGIFYLDGKNILDMLCEAFPDATSKWPARTQLPVGAREEVYISYIEACNKFFVQSTKEAAGFEHLANEITNHAQVAPPLKNFETGINCLARSSVDSQWYRVEIVNVTDTEVLVYYVDYGNEEKIPRSELRSIRNKVITQVPPLAIQCILNGFDGLPFDAELYGKFEQAVLNKQKRLEMIVHEVKSPALVVDLYDVSGKPIINISAMVRNMQITDANPINKEPHSREEIVPASQNPRARRSGVKTQPLLGHQNKAKPKSVKPTREENDRWTPRSVNDSRQQSFDNSSFDSQKMGNWQNTSNDDKRFNNQDQKSNKHWMTSPQNDRFNRENPRNERFNTRDTNPRYERSETNERFESDNSSNNFGGKDNRGVRENRGGRGKGYSPNNSRSDRNNSMEKESWSDKDSNASSRGSGKRGGRGAARGAPRNPINNRVRRDFGNDGDRLYKPPRSSGFNNRTPPTSSRFNDRRSNERNDDNTTAQIDTWDPTTAISPTEKKAISPIPQIPPPNITLGVIRLCEIVFVDSPTEFYVQLITDSIELDKIMPKIAEIYETGGTLLSKTSAKVGDGCIAQFSEDRTWYRAVIQSLEPTGAVVQFVDYGNIELVAFDKIKELQKDFAKLPTQAIGCKLLAAAKNRWDASELDRFRAIADINPFEIEFISLKNNIYEVLLRQVVDGKAIDPYINKEFSDSADLIQAKEAARNKTRPVSTTTTKSQVANNAPLNQKWSEPPIYFGNEEEVIVTWLTNPNNFYCQFARNQKEFKSMMNDVQKVYAGRQPTKQSLEIGSSVIAIYTDMAFYRAEVLELHKPHGISVRYVDFGNCATVQQRQIFNVEKRFMILPKQAVNCTLKNIVPASTTNWPSTNSEEIDKLFNVDKLQCIFHETKNNKHIVTLKNNGEDVAAKMVEKSVAAFDVVPPGSDLLEINDVNAGYPNSEEHLTGVDISRLTGQTLRVKVSSVESVNKFHIQLPSAAASEKIVTDFMANKDSKVMPKLLQCEVCLGAGCLVQTYEGWRRAVVINCSQTTGIEVRFFDTGAIDVIPLDRMVALPGELALMQKQAIECCLQDVSSSTDNDGKLKSLIENTEVIMQVIDVKNNRLVVRLFDDAGRRIRITAKETNENICPLLPMPILFCVHRATISHVNHSGSVWLKRLADTDTDTALIDELYNYYEASGKPFNVNPGQLCAAHSADGNWYRARIMERTETGAIVHYVDYGNTEEIANNLLKELEPQFFKQPQLAIEAALTINVDGTETEQQKLLETHLLDKEFMASLFQDGDKWMVDIMLEPGVKIGDVLSPLGVIKSKTIPGVIECEDLVVGNRFRVSVCHAESPTQFWIQRLQDSSALNALQEKLQIEAPNCEMVNGVPEEKSLCAALYSVDKMWYRAEVIDADEEMVTLRFIDFGNTDTILDLAGGMKHLPDEMKLIAPYATKCRLDLIPSGDDWNQEACSRFAALTTNDSIDAIVISDGNCKRIELFIDGKSVSDILIKENHALKLQANEELIDEVVELELDPKSAFVSHINSPSEFWVQEEKSVANLELIADRFLVADMFPKIDDIKTGQLCVAKFPEDMSWYRARVISQGDSGINVIYIDYGNSAVSTEIRAIPDDLAVIPPLSRKCSLPLPPSVEKWSDEACQKFCKMADEGATIFLLDVLEEGETSIVKLTFEGNDIVDELEKYCEKSEPINGSADSTLICVEESNDAIHISDISSDISNKVTENGTNKRAVFVSQVNSPSEFWIHEESFTDALATISERLTNAPSYQKMNESEMEEGGLYVALFPEDLCWYRARIISHGDTGTNVLFIDYGNTAVITDIRKIPDDLALIAPLSKKCSLVLPEGISQWSDESCQEFFKLVDGGAAKFSMIVLEESETLIVKLILNDEDISNRLTDLCEKHVPIIEERLPPLGEENSPNVVVSHVVSPGEFWTQAESKITELEVMADHLSNAASFLPLNKLEEGIICAAEFPEDGLWYRAKILCHSESETEVLYIDYGNSAVTSEIRALPEDIVKIAPLSKLCALKIPDGIESWSNEACEKFMELVDEGRTMFEFQELYGVEPTHVKLQINGQDVVTILSPLCKIVNPNDVQSLPNIPLDSVNVQEGGENCSIEIIDKPTTMGKIAVEITEYNGDEVQTIIVSDICETQTQDKSTEEHSSNTSGVDIPTTGSSENSTLNSVSEKFETLINESTNSTTESIIIERQDTESNTTSKIEESITSLIKTESSMGENLREDNTTIPDQSFTKEPKNEDDNAVAQIVATDTDVIVNEEKIVPEDQQNNAVPSTSRSSEKDESVQEVEIIDELPNEETAIIETNECDSSIVVEKIVQNTSNEPVDMTVTDSAQTNEMINLDAIPEAAERNPSVSNEEKIHDTVNQPQNPSETATINGTQSIVQNATAIKNEEILKTSATKKTPLSEKLVAGVVTDNDLLVSKQEEEIITVESVEMPVS